MRAASPFVLTSLGALVVGLVLGMILGGLLPALRAQPQPIQIDVVPDSSGAVAEPVTPDVRGLPEKDARQSLADHGVVADTVQIKRVPHLFPEGYVVAQDPIGGTKNPTQVVLSLPEPATVPDLAGRDESAAREALTAMGANPTVIRRYAADSAPGQVIETAPKFGEALIETVQLVVAATPQTAYLAKVRSTGGCSSNRASVNGLKFENSVSCSSSGSRASEIYWLLNRRTGTFARPSG